MLNRQRRDEVPTAWLTGVAKRVVSSLRIEERGAFVIACIDGSTMRRLNRRFTGQAGLTDVLSFRYAGEPVIGEILICPEFARIYSAEQRLSYRQELARYVVHGLLHWVGYDDRTPFQRRRMRERENRALASCAG